MKKRSSCAIVKGTPRARFKARFIKNELEAFLLDTISRTVQRADEQMFKVPKKINADEFKFCYSDYNEK